MQQQGELNIFHLLKSEYPIIGGLIFICLGIFIFYSKQKTVKSYKYKDHTYLGWQVIIGAYCLSIVLLLYGISFLLSLF